jgi:hypothetical protein
LANLTALPPLVRHLFKLIFFQQAIKYRVVMTEKHLQGPNRFVSEGLATTKECKTLVSIAKMFAILGDGYQGKKSPHTVMEKFEGVTLNRTALLVYFGLLDPKYLELYLRLTDTAKVKVQEFFQVKKQLYFTYTHLVCRSALPGKLLLQPYSRQERPQLLILVCIRDCISPLYF